MAVTQLVDKPILSFRGAPQGYLLRGAKRRGNPQSFSCKFAEKRKNCAIWEQIATPVCGLARNDSLSINPLYAASSSFTQGELEGAKPASNQIKCRAKPCLARRAWSEATIFVPQGGTKITTLFQAVEKSRRLFRQPEGTVQHEPCPFPHRWQQGRACDGVPLHRSL